MSWLALLMTAAGVVFGGLLPLWAVSVYKRDASIIDIAWGPLFLLVALVGLRASDGPRVVLVTVLVGAWAIRLGAHLFARSRGQPEDHRYRTMREHWGPGFWWGSLFTVFALQGALVLVVSLPLQAVAVRPAPLGPWDVAGALVALSGLVIEAIADLQLTRFRRDPDNRGRVLDAGLWRYSRHPNYFGNAVLWWGLGLLAVPASWPAAVAGPAVMTILLLQVSGVSLLERTIVDRRPAYRDYIARTPAFFPGWPRDRT